MQVERWRNVYRSNSPYAVPLLEEAAAWLAANAPPLDRVRVVHGDAGPGNFVHHKGEIVAVTDFEFCHLGDPADVVAHHIDELFRRIELAVSKCEQDVAILQASPLRG